MDRAFSLPAPPDPAYLALQVGDVIPDWGGGPSSLGACG
jgi:hypothetical protein